MLSQSQNKTALAIAGDRLSKNEARKNNIAAINVLSNILKTSLGPCGLDKMMVDEVGEITISNDGATILKMLDVQHPAAKMMVDLAKQQDIEVGDGTTSVVLIAAELLKQAEDLIQTYGIHPITIISGYRNACKETLKFIEKEHVVSVDSLKPNSLFSCAKTSLSSKIIGETEIFAEMAVNATKCVQTNKNGKTYVPIEKINVLKAQGKGQSSSFFVEGYILNCTSASQEMKKHIADPKIVCLDMDLQKVRMKLGINIVVDNPEKLEDIRKRESEITRERISKILSTGANVILTTKGIDDMSLKMFIDSNAIAVRRCKKEDLSRIAKATGTKLISSLSNLEGEESFDIPVGIAKSFSLEKFGDNECFVLKGTKNQGLASILLRGANEYMLDEMERALHDSFCSVKRILESKKIVAGAGAVECDVSRHLMEYANNLETKEKFVVERFGTSLCIIPKLLAENSAKDSLNLVSLLNAEHYKNTEEKKFFGLDLINGTIQNSIEKGIFEPASVKTKALKSATEAAISILRIDDVINIHPEPKQEKEECC